MLPFITYQVQTHILLQQTKTVTQHLKKQKGELILLHIIHTKVNLFRASGTQRPESTENDLSTQ